MNEENNVENLAAGPELNKLIALEVFGATPVTPEEMTLIKQISWQFSNYGTSISDATKTMLVRKLAYVNQYTGADFEFIQPYDYAARIDYAYEVVRVMREDEWLFDLCDYETSDGKKIIMAGFTKLTVRGEAIGDTDPLAIARAALIAVREWKKFEAMKKVAAESLPNTR